MTRRRRPPAARRLTLWRATRQVRDDAGLAMMFVVSTLLVSSCLIIAVLGVVTSELRPTAYERKASRTIAAAEAGIQAGLSTLRNATSVRPLLGFGGDATLLPCVDATPLTGTVGGTAGALGYSVRIRYFSADPTGQNEAWRVANAIQCIAGSGPITMPLYAYLESNATGESTGGLPATAGNRSESAVYTFTRSDAGVLGGLIHTGQYSTDGGKCWQVPGLPATVGMHISLAACDQDDARQIWSYRKDFSIALSASQTSADPPAGGLCVSADAVGAFSPIDGTGGGNDGVPQGSLVWESVGPKIGTAATFNGTDAWLQTNTLQAAATVMSQGIWFRTTTSTNGFMMQYANIPGASPIANYDRSLWVDTNGQLRFGVWNPWVSPAAVVVGSPGTVTDGNWHFAVGTAGPAGVQLYLDGVKVGTNTASTVAENRDGYWHIGYGLRNVIAWGTSQPAGSYFTGDLAHATTWTRQLTATEISSMYNQSTYSGFQGAVLSSSPKSYWALGGDQGTLDLTLQTCNNTPPQRWSYNDAGRFQMEKLDASALGNQCIYAPDTIGAQLVMVSCGASREWTPDATVGAGGAGESTEQLVNYGEYGRCLDVTNWDLNWPYLIDYPCKQDPTTAPGANQRWSWQYSNVSKALITRYNEGYCLTGAATVNGVVLTKPCTGGVDQMWTVNKDTGVRATSYTIVDGYGRCLGLGPPGATSGGLSQWSTARSQICDGSLEQKWNAPPQLLAASVTSQRETTKG